MLRLRSWEWLGSGLNADLSRLTSLRSHACVAPSLRSLCRWSAPGAASALGSEAGLLACPSAVAFHPGRLQFAVACAGGVWLWGQGVPEETRVPCSGPEAQVCVRMASY